MSDNMKINVIFADGTNRQACISSSAVSLAKRYARMMPSLFDGTGFDPFAAECDNIIAITRADHDALHRASFGRMADFRLGQMDMRISACEMLRNVAEAAAPQLRTGLNLAADLVEELEVINADTRK